ncbi:YfhO family protein [Tenacibaculum sp. SG-28]|uniref:YfhO family protein n=1 Tax=Tenacibaculum sp. SG-28 TaxID=754426 RepID=UPI000CF3C764|nr:YfhO family protein [Tenacibaculum sp. SG-28]PQJ23045.1 hypothetical protein BSU00_01930 [Tenacibaculum sp. SG-28]
MNKKQILPYIIVFFIFSIAALLYFNPVLSGKKIKQNDITQFIGMSKEATDYRAEKGKESYWVGNAFSGMPTYQIGTYFPYDFIRYIDKGIRFLPRPADYLFLYFFGFFILLTALKIDWKLAVLGSLSYGFSTYLIIIFGAGHNAKAHAIGYMPLVLAGVIYVFQKRYLLGFLLTAIAMALEICANHIQMTYYLGFCLLILGIVEAIQAFKQGELKQFGKQVGIILSAILLGVSTNATRLLATKEYATYSTRGNSELTINPDGSDKLPTSGLDKSYITEYSYGILETFNLFIPRFMGGGTVEELDERSNFYEVIKVNTDSRTAREYAKNVFTYWGKQPIVEAPAYIGAVVFLLFFLGVFLVRHKFKYWLVAATVFSILLSWGKNFPVITDAFIEFVPLYNKFRAVSSIQVIAELCVPLLGILGLHALFSGNNTKKEKVDALKKAVYVTGGIALLFALLGASLFTFDGLRDAQYQQMLPELVDAVIADRKAMLFYDSIRSLILVLISASVLWFFIENRIQKNIAIVLLGVFLIFDLVSVDMRYVNKEDFVSARKVSKPFQANKADIEISKDTSHYRVANVAGNLLNEARTSYFHNSIGGYHAAKMRRYQELFEYQVYKNNMEVLNMLNAKYFILGEDKVEVNTNANGNAWFVDAIKFVDSANAEIMALDSLNTKQVAVVNKQMFSDYTTLLQQKRIRKDSTASIVLTNYNVATLKYTTNTSKEQFAVFSEIYYQDGWNAYLDGKKVPHIAVDYVLRGMLVPSGNHIIEFKFEPTVIQKGSILVLLSYLLLGILILYFLYQKRTFWLFKSKQ